MNLKSLFIQIYRKLVKWKLENVSHNLDLFPALNGEPIPYNPSPVFLGNMFDESLCFKTHFLNPRTRALKD